MRRNSTNYNEPIVNYILYFLIGIVLFYSVYRYLLVGGLLSAVILSIALIGISFYFYDRESERQYVYAENSMKDIKKHMCKGSYNKNKIGMFSVRKGIFFCQINAVIQIVILIAVEIYFYLQHSYFIYLQYSKIHSILQIWLIISLFFYIVFVLQYRVVIQRVSEDWADSMRMWDVFSLEDAESNKLEKHTCFIKDYEDVNRRYSQRLLKKRFCFGRANTLDSSTDNIWAVWNDDKIEMVMTVYYDEITEDDLNDLNYILQDTMHQEIKRIHTVLPVYLTCLICVEKDSRVLRNLISSEPQKQKNCFLLQAGLVFKEQKLYLNKTVQGKIYGKMKQDLFGIVGCGLEHR